MAIFFVLKITTFTKIPVQQSQVVRLLSVTNLQGSERALNKKILIGIVINRYYRRGGCRFGQTSGRRIFIYRSVRPVISMDLMV